MTPLLAIGGLAALGLVALFGKRRQAVAGRRPSFSEVGAAIDAAVRAHPQVPRWFAYATAQLESGFDPWIVQPRTGALGLMQILWRAHGAVLTSRGITKSMLLDPVVNADYGVEFMDDLRRAAIAKGYDEGLLWAVVRLRYVGYGWEAFDSPDAQASLANYRPVARKWQARFGA